MPPGKYPWMISAGGCTASVISPTFVLSAAHCFAQNRNEAGTLEGVEITTGPLLWGHPDLDDPQITRHPVAVVHMHPEYRKLTLEEVWGLEPYDVALLELEEPIVLDEYLRLPTRAPEVGEEVIAAGWGRSEEPGRVRHLRETTLIVREHASCFQGDEKRFCSRGNDDDNSNIWSGDSGGPVFVPDGDDFMLLGTNSTSNGDVANTFASHARVVTFVPWILEVAGDEFACSEGPDPICEADIDECALGTHECVALATCENTVGSYECICPDGYTADERTCIDIDECAGDTVCGEGEVCSNTNGGFECACAEGYRDDGQGCADVDECAEGPGCGEHETCTNTDGGFACACVDGYRDDGQGCVDVDECAEGAGCEAGETCANTAGGFDCAADAAPDTNGGGTSASSCSAARGSGYTSSWAPAIVGVVLVGFVWRRR